MDEGDQQVDPEDKGLVARVVAEEGGLLVVAGRLQYRVTDLSQKEGGESRPHRDGEISEDEQIAHQKYARADDVEQLVDRIAVRGMMIVLLAPHHLRVETLDRLKHPRQASHRLPDQSSPHALLPPWMLVCAQPP